MLQAGAGRPGLLKDAVARITWLLCNLERPLARAALTTALLLADELTEARVIGVHRGPKVTTSLGLPSYSDASFEVRHFFSTGRESSPRWSALFDREQPAAEKTGFPSGPILGRVESWFELRREMRNPKMTKPGFAKAGSRAQNYRPNVL